MPGNLHDPHVLAVQASGVEPVYRGLQRDDLEEGAPVAVQLDVGAVLAEGGEGDAGIVVGSHGRMGSLGGA